jgi:hypothetical protein
LPSWLGLSSPGFSAPCSPSRSPASSKSSCVTSGTTGKADSKMNPPKGKKRSPSPPSRRREVALQKPDHTCRTGSARQPGLYGWLYPGRSAHVVLPEHPLLQPERSHLRHLRGRSLPSRRSERGRGNRPSRRSAPPRQAATRCESGPIPGLGKHSLQRLEPEHLEKLYRKMIKSDARPATAHQVHRTIRTALGEANRRGHVSRNVAALAKPPLVHVESVRPYSVDEVQRILKAAMQRAERRTVGDRARSRTATRGSSGLALG